jgi:hypothetical protein
MQVKQFNLLRSWEVTISAILAMKEHPLKAPFMVTTLCGMVLVVGLKMVAASTFNNPPWFFRELPQPTTDDIEMRGCRDQEAGSEDIAIESVEIYAARDKPLRYS